MGSQRSRRGSRRGRGWTRCDCLRILEAWVECFFVQLNAWAGLLFVQDIVPGDVFLAINDVPLFSFPTPVCIQLLDLSSRCQRRKLRIFRRGQR